MYSKRIPVRNLDAVVEENDETQRVAVVNTISEILLTSTLGVEQLKEVCNRVKREVYE